MSTIKKLLALVLALTMVLSVSAAAAYTVIPYGDAAAVDADAEEAVQLLYSLNIMKGDEKGNFNPNATITRAEVAKMIYVILNYGKDDKAVNYTGAKFFTDVEAGAWYEGYVNYAASIKLVQGRPDGTFGPNAPITCAEAAKMLLTAIGYSAEQRGYVGAGWDQQVLADASILGLLDGYNANTNTYAPRQWVAVMFFNALTEALTYDTIVPMTFSGLLTGDNYGSYTTMGWKYFELESFKGIITANEIANLKDGKDPLDADETQVGDLVFENWSTGLTEIGEYARGWYSGDEVLYVTDDGKNTEFMTGEATDIASSSDFKSVTGMKQGGVEYVNFETGDVNGTEAGEWLRVVSNDGNSTADYVFKTTFKMAKYTKINSDDDLVLSTETIEDGDYVLDEDAAKGDVVIYTTIDGITYVEVAPSFEGEAEKYTYKTDALTVDGETYVQSGIDYDETINMWAFVKDADKDTEYTFYQDFFGNIRLFAVDVADAGEFVLLTDAYYGTGRDGKVAAVDAYLNGEIVDVDVNTSTKTDIEMFIKERTNNQNGWNKLYAFENDTVLARYTLNDEGVMTLKDAETWSYTTKGDKDAIITQYIDLTEPVKDTAFDRIEAGETAYYGYVADIAWDADATPSYTNTNGTTEVRVQANKNTVFYYVDEDLNIKMVTGYKNSFDVIDEIVDVKAMYAVATDVEADSADANYWVADVIVIETKLPVFNLLEDEIVLGYDVEYRAVKDIAKLNVIKTDATTDALDVISHNGDDFDTFVKADVLEGLKFFYNTVNEDGESYLVDLTDYEDNAIYAGTVDRASVLYEYVVTTDGDDFDYTEDTVVYDIDKKTNYNKISVVEDGLETGEDYIFYAPKGKVVFAVLVEDDMTQELYDDILLDTQDPSIAASKRSLVNAYKALIDALVAADAQWTEDAADEAKDAIADAVADAELTVVELQDKVEDVKAAVDADGNFVAYEFAADALWAAADKAYQDGIAGTSAAAEAKKVKDAAAAVEGKTFTVEAADLINNIKTAVAADGTTVEVEMPDYSLEGGAGQKTITGVVVTYTAGEATATATITVKVAY